MKFYTLMVVVFLSLGFFSGCDKAKNAPPGTNSVAGSWKIHETITGNCEGEVYPYDKIDIAAIKQYSNILTITYSSLGTDFSGTLNGSVITFSGTYLEDGALNTIDFSGTLSADGNNITGTATWTWSDNEYTCSGTAGITGTKVAQTLANIGGEWKGIWVSDDEYSKGTFEVSIIQSVTNLSGTISIPELDMYNNNLKGTFSGNSILFGDVDDEIEFFGVVESDTSLTGIYSCDYLDQEGTWRAVKSKTN